MACIAAEDEESSDNEEKEIDEESITVTAEVHTQFIRDTCKWHKIDPDE